MAENKNPVSNFELEEEFYEEKAVIEEKKQFIVFYLNNEFYGVNIENLKEVVKVQSITYLPCAPLHILGVINLRGNILSVTDLKKIFGLGNIQTSSNENRIIVIESKGIETGIFVDKVVGTVDAPVEKIEPPMATLGGPAAEYIEGEYEIEGKLLGILNVQKLIK